MARGRSGQAGSPTLAARPQRAPGRGAEHPGGLSDALALVRAELPDSRQAWCPGSGPGGLGPTARRHEALVRHAGALIETEARRLAEPQIARLAARLRAIEATESLAGPDAESDARRRRIMEHDIPAVRQASLRRVLAAVRPVGAPAGSRAIHRFSDESDPLACGMIEDACALFPRSWLLASRADSAMVPFRALVGADPDRQAPPGWRGSYEHSLEGSVLRLATQARESRRGLQWATHELAHRIEALVPGIDRICWAYRQRVRESAALAGGADSYHMHVHGDDDPEAVSELFACGAEALVASPEHFDRVLGQDQDYRRLTLGTLALA